MFGRQPTLPVDLILGTNPSSTEICKTHSEYVQNLRQRLHESYALTAENAKKSAERNKLRFDAKVRAAELIEGDRVLVKNVNIRGKHKLADKWEQSVHIVVKQIDGSPVYVVRPERGNGPRRTFHRVLLLPCGFLPVGDNPEQEPKPSRAEKMNLRSRSGQQPIFDDSDRDFGDEEEEGYFLEGPPQLTTWGPYVQEIESTSLRLQQTSLNPHAPVFTSQNSPTSKEISSDQPDEPPVKATSGVDQPLVQTGDHVIIDVPDCDTRDEDRPSDHCENDTSLPDQRLSLRFVKMVQTTFLCTNWLSPDVLKESDVLRISSLMTS